MVTWRKKLEEAFLKQGEDFEKMTYTGDIDKEYTDGWGTYGDVYFTAWGEKFVYFPMSIDYTDWVGCAPRNPCDLKCDSQGGIMEENKGEKHEAL